MYNIPENDAIYKGKLAEVSDLLLEKIEEKFIEEIKSF